MQNVIIEVRENKRVQLESLNASLHLENIGIQVFFKQIHAVRLVTLKQLDIQK